MKVHSWINKYKLEFWNCSLKRQIQGQMKNTAGSWPFCISISYFKRIRTKAMLKTHTPMFLCLNRQMGLWGRCCFLSESCYPLTMSLCVICEIIIGLVKWSSSSQSAATSISVSFRHPCHMSGEVTANPNFVYKCCVEKEKQQEIEMQMGGENTISIKWD